MDSSRCKSTDDKKGFHQFNSPKLRLSILHLSFGDVLNSICHSIEMRLHTEEMTRLNSNEAVNEGQLLQKIHQGEASLMGTQPLLQQDFFDLQQSIENTHPE